MCCTGRHVVYSIQTVQDPEYSSPEFYDIFTTRGWSRGPEIILQSSLIGVFQYHVVCSFLGKASVIANDVWGFSIAAKLPECAYFISIVFLGLLGLVGLQNIGVRVLIANTLLYVSRTLRRVVRNVVHLFSIAFWSQLIIGRVQDDLEGGCASPNPESFLVYNRKNLSIPKDLVHVILEDRHAKLPLLLVEGVEEIGACRSYGKIFRRCIEW